MAFVIGTQTSGGSFLSSILSTRESTYDPVYDDSIPTLAMWNVLPDFYNLMEDRDLFESLWTGTAQVIASDLLNLWQIDYSKGIVGVPVHSQRKWIKYDFYVTEDFEVDPEIETSGLADKFTYEDGLLCKWLNRGGLDKAFVPLNGEVSNAASLRWSATLQLNAAQVSSCMLIGYYSSSEKTLKNCLALGLLNDPSVADRPYPALVHVSPDGGLTAVRSGTYLTTNTEYRFDCSYTAKTGVMYLSVIETSATKVASTSGATAEDPLGEVTVSEFSDSEVDFGAVGVVAGDLLRVDGVDHVIEAVEGSTIVTKLASLPAGAAGLSYTIKGEEEAFTLSLNLLSDATDPSFSVDQFGTSSLDTRIITGAAAEIMGTQASLLRKRMSGLVVEWSYLDPTTSEVVLSVPRLQDQITEPTEYLYTGTDYTIVDSTFLFQEPPAQAYWAEYSTYDEEHIKKNFGVNVDIEEESSASYKAKVQGLYYAYYQGPRVSAIRLGVHISVGLPIAEAAGTVESVNPAYSGVYGQVVIDGKGYLYPLLAGTSLTVGDTVSQFQPLADGIDILDYISSPRWWVNISDQDYAGTMREIRKYHSFGIYMNLDAFDVTLLSEAAEFVKVIKPTWKDAYFIVHKDIYDTVDMDDGLSIALTLNIRDGICSGALTAYDSADYDGVEMDWRYDQGDDEPVDFDVEWTSAALRGTAGPLGGYASMTIGSNWITGTGTSFEADIGAVGIQGVTTDTGIAGSTNAGGTVLTGDAGELFLTSILNTAGVPDEITHVYIVGAGLARVTEVTSDTELTFAVLDAGAIGDFENLVGVSYTVAVVNGDPGLLIGLRYSGTAGSTTSGDQTLREVGAFSGASAGDILTIDGEASTLIVQEVLSDDEILLDRDIDTTHVDDAEWYLEGRLTFWSPVVYVESDTSLVISAAPTSGVLVGAQEVHLSRLNADYLTAQYDRWDELCPDEEVTFVHRVSAGYQETRIPGRLTFAESSLNVFGVGTTFTTDIAPIGFPPNIFITTPDGGWHEVEEVINDTQLLLLNESHATFTEVPSFMAHEVLAGTFTFTNASSSVACSNDMRAVLSPGDWVQAVPLQDIGDVPAGTPVVQVYEVEPTAGLSFAIEGPYAGVSTGAIQAIRRGTSAVFPLAVDTTTGAQNATGWVRTVEGTVTAVVPELLP